jgi:hypothetical protein
MTDLVVQQGVPSMVLLPASVFRFTVDKEIYSIIIPKSGRYHDLAPGIFSEEDDREFNIYKEGLVDIPAVSKVLFAVKKYPALKDTQLFAPLYIHVREDDVEIIGQVIDVLEPEEK